MPEQKSEIMTPEEWVELGHLLNTPIDFEKLITKGILKKKSGKRYQVLDWRRVPEHVSAQVILVGFEEKRDSSGKRITNCFIEFK